MIRQTVGSESRSDSVFVLIGTVLVALAAVIGGVAVWYTVDVAALSDGVTPAAIGTVVFSFLVIITAGRSQQFTDRLTNKNRSGQ